MKSTKKKVSRLSDRVIVLALMAVSCFVIWIAWSKIAPSLRSKSSVEIKPTTVTISAGNNEQLIITNCFALTLPNDFESTPRPKCNINFYARPRKYQYINVTGLTDTKSLEDLESVWRSRWLNLGAKQISREAIVWAGRPGLRLVEEYPQNGEKFVTYLMQLDRNIPRLEGEAITAFELRGWATNTTDITVIEEAIKHWQWRF